jgi:hypothetical protein|nr:MAG TPA: hypothetical protein [Caudoviricetes sp.]
MVGVSFGTPIIFILSMLYYRQKEGINMIATLAVIAFLIAAAIVEEKEGTSYAGACMIVFVFLSFVVAPIGVILLVLLKLL